MRSAAHGRCTLAEAPEARQQAVLGPERRVEKVLI